MLRAVDADPPHQEFTTYDWLAEVVKGARRAVRQSPEVDFADFASAAIPSPYLCTFRHYREAVELHSRMGRLSAARIGVSPLAAATIGWWSTTTGLLDGAGTWPAFTPAALDTRAPPSPSAPYKSSTTLEPALTDPVGHE